MPPRQPPPPRLIFLLNSAQRRLQHWLSRAQEEAAGEQGAAVSPAQAGVLFALSHADGALMGTLAQTLDIAPSAATGLVDRMQALGWVSRRACEIDGRAQRVWLTPQGQAQLPAVKKGLALINAQLTKGFSEAELQTVARWLQHVQQCGETH